jgi:tight adherence protein B
MSPVMLVAALIAAAAVLLIFWGLFGARRDDVQARLERYASAGGTGTERSDEKREEAQSFLEQLAGSRALTDLNKIVEKRDWGANLARELARADLALKPSEFLAIRAGALLGIPAVVYLLGATIVPSMANPLAYVIAGIVGFWLPGFWLGRRKSSRLKAFNSRLADTIVLIANSLRAGSSFLQSIELVSRETPAPMGEEMGRVVREVNLGLGMEEALANLVRRIKSDDLDLMVTAIGVQQQVGGNLAEILDTIAFTIRERVRIKGEINTLTAQGRMSGYLVAFLPIGIAVALNFINPAFMQPLFTQLLGQILLGVGGVMMVIGFFAIQKIVDIKV